MLDLELKFSGTLIGIEAYGEVDADKGVSNRYKSEFAFSSLYLFSLSLVNFIKLLVDLQKVFEITNSTHICLVILTFRC